MRFRYFLLLFFVFTSCKPVSNNLIGTWKAERLVLYLTISKDSLEWKLGDNKPVVLSYQNKESLILIDKFGKNDSIRVLKCKDDTLILKLKEKGEYKEVLFLKTEKIK